MRGIAALGMGSFGLTAMLLAASGVALAQSATPTVSTPTVSTVDGGTREVLESIFVPPMQHAPFSLTLETEWTRPLGNGGTYTMVNKRHIARDSAGRIYEERWLLVPKGGKVQSRMNYIQIADPLKHTLYNCEVDAKRCSVLAYRASTKATYQPAIGTTGPLPDGSGSQTHEELGNSSVNGFATVGYRETTTLNPGVFGNDQPMVTTREFWYSTQLGINLISKRDSPRSGKQDFTATELSSEEPEAQLFAILEGYMVIDRRKTDAPSQ